MPDVKLFLLGAPRIECNGAPFEVDTRKAVALLAYLALTCEHQSRETLVELLWPEHSPSRARDDRSLFATVAFSYPAGLRIQF